MVRKAADNAKSDSVMRGRRGGSLRPDTYCLKLIKLVMDNNLQPLIVFSFSKTVCQFYANEISKMDFTDGAIRGFAISNFLAIV